jgi:hypothetical protein
MTARIGYGTDPLVFAAQPAQAQTDKCATRDRQQGCTTIDNILERGTRHLGYGLRPALDACSHHSVYSFSGRSRHGVAVD